MPRRDAFVGQAAQAIQTEIDRYKERKKDDAAECVAPSVATASNGSYPIARPLFMYTNGEPQGVVKGYLDWILSEQGQCIIYNKGYAPAKNVNCS